MRLYKNLHNLVYFSSLKENNPMKGNSMKKILLLLITSSSLSLMAMEMNKVTPASSAAPQSTSQTWTYAYDCRDAISRAVLCTIFSPKALAGDVCCAPCDAINQQHCCSRTSALAKMCCYE